MMTQYKDNIMRIFANIESQIIRFMLYGTSVYRQGQKRILILKPAYFDNIRVELISRIILCALRARKCLLKYVVSITD